jgi:hypothetical protein
MKYKHICLGCSEARRLICKKNKIHIYCASYHNMSASEFLIAIEKAILKQIKKR